MTKQLTCINVNTNIARATVTLAEGINQNDKGLAAKNIITLNFSDPKEAQQFEPSKKYSITITEE